MDYLALLGTGIIVLIGLALRSLYRRYQATRQQERDRQYAAGLAAGKLESSRLAYVQGHEDGLVEGRAQAGRAQTISAETRYNKGYDQGYDQGYQQGQSDLLSALTDQARDERPALSA